MTASQDLRQAVVYNPATPMKHVLKRARWLWAPAVAILATILAILLIRNAGDQNLPATDVTCVYGNAEGCPKVPVNR